METIVLEQGIIGLEIDICAILILGIGGMVADKLSTLEDQLPDFSLPVRLHLKTGTKRVDRLDAHAIEADALLESLAVILAARIEHAHSLHASDVHTWTGTHMLHIAQVANVLVGILYGFLGRLFRKNRVLV